jgi:hypothetical protein
MVGVVPNAACRHFADRDELPAAVCAAAMRQLADRIAARVHGKHGDPAAARRRATAKVAARRGRKRTRPAAGEKPDRKRMATPACVYDAEPAPRRPYDVIARPAGATATARSAPGPKREPSG